MYQPRTYILTSTNNRPQSETKHNTLGRFGNIIVSKLIGNKLGNGIEKTWNLVHRLAST